MPPLFASPAGSCPKPENPDFSALPVELGATGGAG